MSFKFYPFYDGKLKSASTDFTGKIMYKRTQHGKPLGMWHDAAMTGSGGTWPTSNADTDYINYSVGSSAPGTKTIYAVRVGTGSDAFGLWAYSNHHNGAAFGPGHGADFAVFNLNWYKGQRNESYCPVMVGTAPGQAMYALDVPARFTQQPNRYNYNAGEYVYYVQNIALCRMRQARWVVTFWNGVSGGYTAISTWELAASGGELDSPVGTYTHWASGWTGEATRPTNDTINTVSVETVTV